MRSAVSAASATWVLMRFVPLRCSASNRSPSALVALLQAGSTNGLDFAQTAIDDLGESRCIRRSYHRHVVARHLANDDLIVGERSPAQCRVGVDVGVLAHKIGKHAAAADQQDRDGS